MRNVNKQFDKEGHLYYLIEGKNSTLKFKTGRDETKNKKNYICVLKTSVTPGLLSCLRNCL